MACLNQKITKDFALYNGDSIEVMGTLPSGCVDLSIYSPPFCGMYVYSSNERDLSNCKDYKDFMNHYAFVVREIARLTKPGRCTAVHCMDVPTSNSGTDGLKDFPGDIIRLHEAEGWKYICRHAIWKEPLAVRLRTMQKNLAHQSLVEDSIDCGVAGADYMLIFRKAGENKVPVAHPTGLHEYYGEREIPLEKRAFRGWLGKQTENIFSHWIWRQYASSIWDDIRIDEVLKYEEARDKEDERHVHPLQLDAIDRVVVMRSNPGETVLTPFMGVGSEVYSPVRLGRKGIGIELKPSYYRQAVKNVEEALKLKPVQPELFDAVAVTP